MDNRGSKSAKLNSNVVKEQGVYGSWSVKSNLTDLRCTLTGFEINCGINHGFCWSSRIKIPSKQFRLDLQSYHVHLRSLSLRKALRPSGTRARGRGGSGGKWRKKSYSTSTPINPGVWSGLIDGKGYFSIILVKNSTRKYGFRVEP